MGQSVGISEPTGLMEDRMIEKQHAIVAKQMEMRVLLLKLLGEGLKFEGRTAKTVNKDGRDGFRRSRSRVVIIGGFALLTIVVTGEHFQWHFLHGRRRRQWQRRLRICYCDSYRDELGRRTHQIRILGNTLSK